MPQEIEVRFLKITPRQLAAKLEKMHAIDRGELLLDEVIFYDQAQTWRDEHKYVRLRKSGDTVTLTYKHNTAQTIDSMHEIEVEIDDFEAGIQIIEATGLLIVRRQQKKRHTYIFGDVTLDFDTWPGLPTYLELEGPDENSLRKAASSLGLDWKDVVTLDARSIIEQIYGIPVSTMTEFVFLTAQ
jgi:adenylate cyclase class 2